MSAESLVVYLNGEYVPRNQARISIFDVGFLRGDAVFDTTSAWNGRIFKLPAHLERLELSLRAARIQCPLPPKALADVIVETTRRCGLRNAYIQTIVTRGEPPFGVRDLTQCRPGLMVFAIPYAWILGPEQMKTGGRATIVSTRALPVQCLDPKIKSLSRQHFDLAVLQGKAAGMDLSIKTAVLSTPIPNAFALPGAKIYLLNGLLAKAENPDEIAGVLAHEFGHLKHRDATRNLIYNGGTSFLIGLLFGDVTGSGALIFASRSLVTSSYSREAEYNADTF